jgi:MFS family permease
MIMQKKSHLIKEKYYTLVFSQLFISEVTGTIFTLYLLSKGMRLIDVNIILAAFFITILIMEIPTGVIADVFGRKISITLGFVFNAIAGCVFLSASNLGFFIIAEILFALGETLLSGAMEAWMVESINLQEENNNDIEIIFSHAGIIRQIAGMLCGIIGALVATYSYTIPWIIGIIISVLTVIFSILFIKEPFKGDNCVKFTNPFKSMKAIAGDSFNYSFKNTEIIIFFIIAILISFSNSAGNSFQQPRLVGLFGDRVWIMGWIKFLYSISMMIGAWFVAYLCKKKIKHIMILFITGLIVGAFQILSGVFNTFTPVLCTFLLYEIGRGMYNPISQIYLNARIPSDKRATILSFSSSISQIGMVIGLILTGIISNLYHDNSNVQEPIRKSWIICGSIAILAAFIAAIYNYRKRKFNGVESRF